MTGKVANLSNYPNGFDGGLTLREVPVVQAQSGKVLWVGDGDTAGNTAAFPNRKTPSNGNKGSYLAPFATLDYAIGQCTADRGDIIYVLPGYVDVLSAAADVDVDVDGVSIIGLGSGDKQPLIGFDNAAATFEVNADNVSIQGLHFQAQVTTVAKGIDVVDGADDFRVQGCRFTTLNLGTDEFNDAIFITTSDRGIVVDNYFDMGTAVAQSAVHFVTCVGLTIENNYVIGDYAVACLEDVAAPSEKVLVRNNVLFNGVDGDLNALPCISFHSSTTAAIEGNTLYTGVANPSTGAIIATSGACINNQAQNTLGGVATSGGAQAIGAMEITMADGVDDETLTAFTIDGGVLIHALYGITTTVANGSESLAAITEATSTPATATLIADGETHTATVVGDLVYAASPGAVVAVAEVADSETTDVSWGSGFSITGAETIVDLTTTGTGTHAMTLICVWSPVTPGAEVLETLA
jgi:hypothetical protein